MWHLKQRAARRATEAAKLNLRSQGFEIVIDLTYNFSEHWQLQFEIELGRKLMRMRKN